MLRSGYSTVTGPGLGVIESPARVGHRLGVRSHPGSQPEAEKCSCFRLSDSQWFKLGCNNDSEALRRPLIMINLCGNSSWPPEVAITYGFRDDRPTAVTSSRQARARFAGPASLRLPVACWPCSETGLAEYRSAKLQKNQSGVGARPSAPSKKNCALSKAPIICRRPCSRSRDGPRTQRQCAGADSVALVEDVSV